MVFVVALGSLVVGMVLVALIARYGKHPHRVPEDVVISGRMGMPFEQFRALMIDLFEGLGIEITFFGGNQDELDLYARSREPLKGGRYIVHCHLRPPGDTVGQEQMLALQESVKAEGFSKGILITPYEVERGGLANLDVEIDVVDGSRLRKLVEEYLPKRVDELARYRGFGF